MSKLLKKQKSRAKKLVNLKFTTKVENIQLPEQHYLDELYSEELDNINKAVWLVINSIITQKRVFFTITRKALIEMAKNDKNDHNISINTRNYNQIIATLTNEDDGTPWIRVIKKGDSRTPHIYELMDEDALELVKVDELQQLQEAVSFVTNKRAEEDANFDFDDEEKQEEYINEVTKFTTLADCTIDLGKL